MRREFWAPTPVLPVRHNRTRRGGDCRTTSIGREIQCAKGRARRFPRACLQGVDWGASSRQSGAHPSWSMRGSMGGQSRIRTLASPLQSFSSILSRLWFAALLKVHSSNIEVCPFLHASRDGAHIFPGGCHYRIASSNPKYVFHLTEKYSNPSRLILPLFLMED
jgi:hypothetical protein